MQTIFGVDTRCGNRHETAVGQDPGCAHRHQRGDGHGGDLSGAGGAPDANLQSETGRYAQRIIYFHIATAWVGFLAFFVTFVAGIGYLRTQNRKWDIVALSSAEIGTVFMLGVLISGSIWAKPAWGVWWVWDERLTISLIQFLVYVGYLMLRSFGRGSVPAGRALPPCTGSWLLSRCPSTLSPSACGAPAPRDVWRFRGRAGPQHDVCLLFSLVTFTVWYVTLMWHRIRLEQFRDGVEELKQKLMD